MKIKQVNFLLEDTEESLEEYRKIIETKDKQQQQQHQEKFFLQGQSYFKLKIYKKLVYEETSDSEPEAETEEIAPEVEIVEQVKEKTQQQKQQLNTKKKKKKKR